MSSKQNQSFRLSTSLAYAREIKKVHNVVYTDLDRKKCVNVNFVVDVSKNGSVAGIREKSSINNPEVCIQFFPSHRRFYVCYEWLILVMVGHVPLSLGYDVCRFRFGGLFSIPLLLDRKCIPFMDAVPFASDNRPKLYRTPVFQIFFIFNC